MLDLILRRCGIPWALALLLALPVTFAAGEDAPDNPNSPQVKDVTVVTEMDAFGQEVQLVRGRLLNRADQAYEGITLWAEVFDDDGDLIGEGIGYPVTACGVGLLPAFALQPDGSQSFSIALDWFEDEIEFDRVEVEVQARAVEPLAERVRSFDGVQEISAGEVVRVEWIDDESLRFGDGCFTDVFTRLSWYEVDLDDPQPEEIEHPAAEQITDALLRQLGLTDPTDYDHSLVTFSPTARRIVYQTDINVLWSSEQDGSFKRLLYNDLYRHSLRGFIWLPQGRFLAYYYGAYGDPVRYVAASVDGERISAPLSAVTPSQTIPGPTPDGSRAVIATTIDDVTGYYLVNTSAAQTAELLFAAEPPGNNWPAPVYRPDVAGATIYLARPVEDEARLQCYSLTGDQLEDVTPLPLQLSTDERAWLWASPDGRYLALSADGINGGLWLIDLDAFDACQPVPDEVDEDEVDDDEIDESQEDADE
jgi:hypothetical protein